MSDWLVPRIFRSTQFLRLSWAAHGLGAAALVVAPDSWRVVVAGLLANHAVIGFSGMWPQSRLLGPNLFRLPEPPRARVALTFDDGPDPQVTPAVLDILDSHRAKATFFCIGRRVDAHPALAAEILARGHAVENHSYSHPITFAFGATRSMEREVLGAQDAIERATGQRPRFFRAPVGIRNPWLEPCIARAGLSLVSWTRRGFDAVWRDAEAVTRRLLRGLRAGDILLLHDGGVARNAAGRPIVVETLPRVLDALAARGLTSAALPALLHKA
jgi:peptidoglycan/xylan/chitin deacetylase (PgdA/CDA1 family)